MIGNLDQLRIWAEEQAHYLRQRGVAFDNEGFPLLPEECFLSDWPEYIVDFYHRNGTLVVNREKALICHFRDDRTIYRRLEHVHEDIDIYRGFMGVCASDVTVTRDMDIEWQAFSMLVNQLFMAVLAVNGIKVVPSTRCGDEQSTRHLSSIPKGMLWISSTLGCDNLRHASDLEYVSKIMRIRPRGIMLYGKRDPILEAQLDTVGVAYRNYGDVHDAYKTTVTSTIPSSQFQYRISPE